MLELAFWYVILTGTSALAAFVAARAWDYPPARLFVAVCATLLVIRLFADLRDMAATPAQAAPLAALSNTFLAGLDLLLLLLFAGLFAPNWFAGRRPAVWIAIPYVAAMLMIALDGTLALGIVFTGAQATAEGYRLQPARPGGTIMLGLFFLSWIPHLSLLITAFIKQPLARLSIGMLLGALVLAQVTGALGQAGILQSLPILLGLAYVVLRTRLVLPTRAGIETAVRAMSDAVVILDGQSAVTYANPAALAAGLQQPAGLASAHAATTGDGHMQLDGRSLVVQQTTLNDPGGRSIGSLLIGRDVTELEERQRLLESERSRLAESVASLSAARAEREALAEAVRQLAMPVIPVMPGVLVMPLVGNFDDERIDSFTTTLLKSIERERARLVLIDITGLPLLDTAGAAGLISGVRAAALLGAHCVLAGVRPEIAQALVSLGVDLGELGTAATLQQALSAELAPRKG